jgi:hypothetical protein
MMPPLNSLKLAPPSTSLLATMIRTRREFFGGKQNLKLAGNNHKTNEKGTSNKLIMIMWHSFGFL